MNLGLLIALLSVNSVGLVVAVTVGVWSLVFQRRIARDTFNLAKVAREEAAEACNMAMRLLEVTNTHRNKGDLK